MAYEPNPRQVDAIDAMAAHIHTCLGGGSRSGKTFIILRAIIVRAQKVVSRHLMVRLRFKHIKASVCLDTLPKVMRICFPAYGWTLNKTDWYVTLENGSQIWFAGTDDSDRVERILGTEYTTIAFNEISQFKDYSIITTVLTRLAENTSLTHRVFYDLNPCSKKHWGYQLFIDKKIPDSDEPLPDKGDYCYLSVNPVDNLQNLPESYLKILESLPKRQKERFMLGHWLSDIEGALWTDQMLIDARALEHAEIVKTIIAVDPAVTHQENSDETGIVPCSIDTNGNGVVHDDLSQKASTATWGQRVVNAYYEFQANAVVVETNQGGDLVIDLIHSIDNSIKVIKVHASKGKFARAEPVAALYEKNLVCHKKRMPLLDTQLVEYVPLNEKKSPDRLDALVWGLTYLVLKAREARIRQL